MGNCISVGSAGSSPTKSTNRDSSTVSNGTGTKIPKEDRLHLVHGRLCTSAGRSRFASIHTQQGRKGVNQDAMLLWEEFGGEGGDAILCGVFDGHGPHGHLVARKVRDALPLKLLASLPKSAKRQLAAVPVSSWRDVFTKAFKAMDRELRSHPSVDCFCSGSTAVTVLKLGSSLFIGNVGDSRAVLGSKDETTGETVAVQLTVDLKPDLPREAERIKKCKGRVFAMQDEPDVPRVWLPFDDAPGLAMARAFGDFCLKDYGVISLPEFFHWTLTESDQFVILASDGIWDVLSNKEVIDIVSSAPNRSMSAKVLVEAAAREWRSKYPTSKMDDCAVVCLFLDRKIDSDGETADIYSSSVDNVSRDSFSELSEDHNQEPSLTRAFTVRSSQGSRLQVAVASESSGDGTGGIGTASEDNHWSGIDGVTRVNSLVQLPRFSEREESS